MRVKVHRRGIDELLDDYYIMFDDTFPTYQLGLNEDIIKDCLHQGKDVYELGYLEHDDNLW